MMSRSMVLVFLLLLLVITSQFEWKQQSGNDPEANLNISEKQNHASQRKEVVKEKIILSQEKNIQKLNELVRNLRGQLLQCRGSKNAANTTSLSTESISDPEP